MDNWDDLRIFLAVARKGTVSGGAQHLKVQHSTVSRRIRMLEQRLGAQLFERRPSGYLLTRAGKNLKQSAESMELAALEIDDAVSGQNHRAKGTLRVSALNNMASSVLMPLFARFSRAFADIDLHVQVSNRYRNLHERQADIAIRLTDAPDPTLVGSRLTRVVSAPYAHRDYARRLGADPKEVCWLGIECCGFHEDWTQAACPEPNSNIYLDDTLLTLAALKQGLGVAYLPCFMGDNHDDLVRIRQPAPEHDLELWLLYDKDLRGIRRITLFREFMLREIKALVPLFEGRKKVSP